METSGAMSQPLPPQAIIITAADAGNNAIHATVRCKVSRKFSRKIFTEGKPCIEECLFWGLFCVSLSRKGLMGNFDLRGCVFVKGQADEFRYTLTADWPGVTIYCDESSTVVRREKGATVDLPKRNGRIFTNRDPLGERCGCSI